MNRLSESKRRTVLKTISATAVGGSFVTGIANAARASPPGKAHGRRSELEIVARHDGGDFRFELSSREIASGWTTFEFDNQTDHPHFVYSWKVPAQAIADAESEGMDLLRFWIETVTKPFQFFMDEFHVPGKSADPDDNTDIYDSLFPPWFGEATFYGGPGLTAGDRSSRTTIALDSGKYILECYVKDANNDFHSYLGMIDQFTVTDEESDGTEPESTVNLTLTNSGIDVSDSVRPGQHVVAVEVEEQQAYSNLVGHDIHLIRFDEETDVDDVNGWMNWIDHTQLLSDGDVPQTFVGGIQDIWTEDLSRTGYFHVTLKPGDYAWVAEIPDPRSKGFLTEFSVPFGRDTG